MDPSSANARRRSNSLRASPNLPLLAPHSSSSSSVPSRRGGRRQAPIRRRSTDHVPEETLPEDSSQNRDHWADDGYVSGASTHSFSSASTTQGANKHSHLDDDEETGLTGVDRQRRRRRKRRNTMLEARLVDRPYMSNMEKSLVNQSVLQRIAINVALIGLWYLFSLSISIVCAPRLVPRALFLLRPSGGPPGATAWSFFSSLHRPYSFRDDPPGALRGPLRGA